MYYWAYGSNLNVRAMRERCPRARKVGRMAVKDCALVFRGVLDVTVRKGVVTPGGLWKITPQCEASLDRYEGVAGGLYVKRYLLIEVDGRKEDCLLYQMATDRGIMPPSIDYYDTVARGYEDFGLDPAPLKAAVREAWGDKEVTPLLRERHIRKGKPKLARIREEAPATETAAE